MCTLIVTGLLNAARRNVSFILLLCPFERKTAIANRGSYLLSDGVFGGHLSNGTGRVPQNHVQNKFWNILIANLIVVTVYQNRHHVQTRK